MNSISRNIIMNRRRRASERGDGYSYRISRYPDYASTGEDYAMRRDRRGMMRDYDDHERDYRQGVKGTGRYGIGGSRYYGDHAMMRDGHYDEEWEDGARGRDYGRDYNRDYNREHDYRDYADESMRLTKAEVRDWKKMIENSDGSLGEHFEKGQIMSAAEKIGVRYNGYDENELCLTANVLYSDYGEALKMYIPADKEAIVYTKMAKAFLEDSDAPEGWEKLAIYYHCIVKDDEE